jgi:hypothetical protein
VSEVLGVKILPQRLLRHRKMSKRYLRAGAIVVYFFTTPDTEFTELKRFIVSVQRVLRGANTPELIV